MPAYATPQPESSQHLSSCSRLGSGAHSLLALRLVAAALFAACMLLPGTTVAAQGSPTPAAVPAQSRLRQPQAAIRGHSTRQSNLLQRQRRPSPNLPTGPPNVNPPGYSWLGQPGLAHRGLQFQPGADLERMSLPDGATLEGMGRTSGSLAPTGRALHAMCSVSFSMARVTTSSMVGDQAKAHHAGLCSALALRIGAAIR